MEQILTELERILDALADPASLDGGEIAVLTRRWVLSISQLKDALARGVSPGADVDESRQRLEAILARMPKIQSLLVSHKSEVAEQLFSENRRVQAMRQGGYAALAGRPQFLQQRA